MSRRITTIAIDLLQRPSTRNMVALTRYKFIANNTAGLIRSLQRRHASSATNFTTPSPINPNIPHLLQRRPSDIAKRIVSLQFLLTRWGELPCPESSPRHQERTQLSMILADILFITVGIESAYQIKGDYRIKQSFHVVKSTVNETGMGSNLTHAERTLLLQKELGGWTDEELWRVGKQWVSLVTTGPAWII